MTSPHACTCGYEATSTEDLRDHMAEMFTPDDNRAPDGQFHAEAAAPALACLCGYQAKNGPAELDAHLTHVFTPADRVGHDGIRHLPASPAPRWAGEDRHGK